MLALLIIINLSIMLNLLFVFKKIFIKLTLILGNREHTDTFKPACLSADILASMSEIYRKKQNRAVMTGAKKKGGGT